MVKTRHLIVAAFVVLLVGVGLGLVRLMHLRLERGDVYPPGSSLRVDPLGGKAYAESLDAMPGVEVERNFRDWEQLELDRDATLYVVRVPGYAFFTSEDRSSRVLDFVASGGRLVFSQGHSYDINWDQEYEGDLAENEDEETERKGIFKREKEENVEAELPERDFDEITLADTWELRTNRTQKDVTKAIRVAELAAAPERIQWTDQRFFDDLPPGWEVVYETEFGPVVIRREYGRGTVIGMTDPYLFTNESLLRHREVEWLSWVHGSARSAVFDEWHFGVAEPRGIAILMRRYQLGGFALALAFATALFVWRNTYSLMPVREESDTSGAGIVRLSGSSQSGLRNLLKRAIIPADLLTVCAERFIEVYDKRLKGAARWQKARSEINEVVDAQRTVPPRKRTPVAAYREISRILTKYRIHLK
ncbi:MAG: DUF4350 domain-containing protein [Puniceicoccales bacterium]